MAQIARGKIQNGSIVFPEPLPLPDGIEVVVRIDVATVGTQITPLRATRVPDARAHFAALPFFGMWADREDIWDSAAWVRKEREQWQRRLARQD